VLTLPASRQWYKNFVLPWADVPTSVRAKLNSHTTIAPKKRRGVVRTFMDSILNVCASPRKSELAAIAKEMADLYPESFMDSLGTEVIAGGYNDLLNRLCERRDNVCRGPSQSVKRQCEDDKPKKRRPRDSYGIVQWNPIYARKCGRAAAD